MGKNSIKCLHKMFLPRITLCLLLSAVGSNATGLLLGSNPSGAIDAVISRIVQDQLGHREFLTEYTRQVIEYKCPWKLLCAICNGNAAKTAHPVELAELCLASGASELIENLSYNNRTALGVLA